MFLQGARRPLRAPLRGRLALVGETESGGTGMLRIDTHAWSAVEGIGFFDLSLDLRTGGGPGWARWPGSCLAGSAFSPNPAAVAFELYAADERLAWESRASKALQVSGFAAQYLGESYEDLSA
jgi:hypothetical protein